MSVTGSPMLKGIIEREAVVSEASVPDVETEAFGARLANLLVATRRNRGISIRTLAARSNGRFTKDDLRRIEAGGRALPAETVRAVTEVYGADLGAILPMRVPVIIGDNLLSAGGVTSSFVEHDVTSLLIAYLQLVRSLRRQLKTPIIDLRRDDIDILAADLHEPAPDVVDRLAALMGASRSQRTQMLALFSAGAIVIGLVAGARFRESTSVGATDTIATVPAIPTVPTVPTIPTITAIPRIGYTGDHLTTDVAGQPRSSGSVSFRRA